MIGLFKQKSPGNVAILLLFGLLLKLPLFLYPKPIVATVNDGRLYQLLISYLPVNGTGNALLCSLISFLLLYIQGLMINYLINEYRLITKPNYLPGMSFLLVTSLLPDWNYLSAPLVANTFIIWMFIKLFRLYNSPKAQAQVFNIGLVAGISSYIYFPSTLFVFCILIGLMILRPFRLNEAVLLLLGGITPYYFHAVYLFLNDQLSIENFFPHISVRIPAIKNTIWLAVSTLLLAIPFLIGGYYVQTHLRKMLIQVRKNWSILLLYLVLSFVIPFVNNDRAFHAWLLISTPFTAFHACAYFYPPRKGLPLLLFYITVGFVLFQQYGTQGWH